MTDNGVIALFRHCILWFICLCSVKKQHRLMAKRLALGARPPGLNSSPTSHQRGYFGQVH